MEAAATSRLYIHPRECSLPLRAKFNLQLAYLPVFWAFCSSLSLGWASGGLGARDGAFQANLLSACWQDHPPSPGTGLRARTKDAHMRF